MWCMGLVALWLVGYFQTRDQTPVSYIGRHVLYHWATREAQGSFLIFHQRLAREFHTWLNDNIQLHVVYEKHLKHKITLKGLKIKGPSQYIIDNYTGARTISDKHKNTTSCITKMQINRAVPFLHSNRKKVSFSMLMSMHWKG